MSLARRDRWASSNHLSTSDCLRHSYLLSESLHGILSLQLFELDRCVLVKEFIDWQVTATNSNVDLVLVDLDVNTLAAELVDTLGFSHEHDLQLLTVGVVVDVLGDTLVNRIVLDGNVNCDTGLQVDDVVSKSFDFLNVLLARSLSFFELSQEFEALASRSVELVFDVDNVFGGWSELILKFSLGNLDLVSLI